MWLKLFKFRSCCVFLLPDELFVARISFSMEDVTNIILKDVTTHTSSTPNPDA